MKYLLWIGVAVAVVIGAGKLRGGSAPGAADVTPKLRTFLATGQCAGEKTLNFLEDVEVGAFSKEMGGWPVYASYETTCRDGNVTTTFNGRDGAKRKVACAFARRGAGGQVELFIPDIFANAMREMEAEGAKVLEKMNADWENRRKVR